MNASEWIIETDWSAQESDEFLRKHAPWRINVKFSNGTQAFDLETFGPLAPYPLAKLNVLEQFVPRDAFYGPVLDVGHNVGHNSFAVAQRYGAQVVGIDFNSRHQSVARGLQAAHRSPLDCTFIRADAEEYCEPGRFSLVLHLGTLYHLRNPVRSLEAAARNLRSGGWLALETVGYIGPGADQQLNKWIYGFNGDKTNYWALSKDTITEVLSIAGMSDVQLVKETHPAVYEGEMSRVLFVARKD